MARCFVYDASMKDAKGTRPVSTFGPGDAYLRGHGASAVLVTILRPAEPCKDRFGRDMVQFWARREDTGEEGYVVFGPAAVVRQA
jgi:hypothetical protein